MERETTPESTNAAARQVPADREDILAAARLAGLRLPAAYEAEMLDAYAHLRPLLARLPRVRPHRDEPAHIFDPLAFQPEAS